MARKIVIIGAGGFGREAYDLIDKEQFTPVGFIDSSENVDLKTKLPIIGDDSIIQHLIHRDIAECAVVAIGDIYIRKRVFEACLNHGLSLPSIIHPTAVIFPSDAIELGAVIYPGVVVMSNARVGRSVILNSGVTVGHDTIIGDFCNINPGVNLAGSISVGARTMVGIGSAVRERISIGDDVVIGAGSVVVKDIPERSVAYGTPAVVLGKNETDTR